MNLEKILKKIESKDPSIGIGAAAATAGILAASLVIKIANKSKLESLKQESEEVKKDLKDLLKEDQKAYKDYVKAYTSGKEENIKKSLKYAIEIPIRIAEKSYRVMELAEIALEQGKKSMVLEAYVAATIARAAVESAVEIAELNLRELKDAEYDKEIRPKKYDLHMMAKSKETEIHVKAGAYIYKK